MPLQMPATRKRARTMQTHKPLLLGLAGTRLCTAASPGRPVDVGRRVPERRVAVVFARAPALGAVRVCAVVASVEWIGELVKGALDRESMVMAQGGAFHDERLINTGVVLSIPGLLVFAVALHSDGAAARGCVAACSVRRAL